MGDLWRNLDAITTIDPARGFRTAEYTRSALNRRIHLVGYRKRYFVMQLGLRLLFVRARSAHTLVSHDCSCGLFDSVDIPSEPQSTLDVLAYTRRKR